MNAKRMLALILLFVASQMILASAATADEKTDKTLKDLKRRIQKLEAAEAKDALDFGGDLRIEAHTIMGEIPDHYDGMALQQVMVNTLFFHEFTGNLPLNMDGSLNYTGPGGVLETLGDADNYGAYMMYLNGLQFSDIPGQLQSMLSDMVVAMGGDPNDPAAVANAQAAAMQQMLAQPGVFTPGYDTDNDILYTTRLRLDMDAKVGKNVTFFGRMAMYKPWGATTAVPVFNGQANTLYTDAATPGVPSSEYLRVERAYFSWHDIADLPLYLSLGRRPSTAGPPLNYRQDEPRGGTPMGTIIDFQFDGATLGYNIGDKTTLRACYGIGYESQYGNGSILQAPADRLKDASFFGFNMDLYNTDETLVQSTIARAFDLTDGFNGYIIMPNNPVTGQPMPGPIVTRFSPSANLGDFDLASVLVTRRDGPFDWFVSGNWSKSRPEGDVTTPFGGLLSDPFEPSEDQTGSMYYVGARWNSEDEMTKIGLEYNHGSQYWFNFAPAQDDLIAPKTSTRGSVIEAYVTHRVNRKFILKLDYIHYDYDYSGSGWHLGRPKDLDEGTPILGFPTYESADKLSLSFYARF